MDLGSPSTLTRALASCLIEVPTVTDNDEVEVIPVPTSIAPIFFLVLAQPIIAVLFLLVASRQLGSLGQAEVEGRGKASITLSKVEKAPQNEEEYIWMEVDVRKTASALRNKGLAEKLVKMIFLSRDWEKWKASPFGKIMKSFFQALVRVSTSLIL